MLAHTSLEIDAKVSVSIYYILCQLLLWAWKEYFVIFFVRFRIEIKRKYWLCSNEKPNLLIWCRTLQDFKEGDVSDEIAAMRLQYYEDKRRVFSKQVEETIRSGIIDDVKNEFPPVIKQPTAMNRTAGSQGRQ